MATMTRRESQLEPLSAWDRALPAVAIVLLAGACAMEFILSAAGDRHFREVFRPKRSVKC